MQPEFNLIQCRNGSGAVNEDRSLNHVPTGLRVHALLEAATFRRKHRETVYVIGRLCCPQHHWPEYRLGSIFRMPPSRIIEPLDVVEHVALA